MRGSVRFLIGIAGLIAVLSSGSRVSAAPLYSADVPCLPAVVNSPDPVALSVGVEPALCRTDLTEIIASADASPGHLGVGLKDTDSGLTGLWSADASFSDDVIFSALPGQPIPDGGSIPVELNLDIAGHIAGSGSFGALVRVTGGFGNGLDFQLRIGPQDCQIVEVGATLHSALPTECSQGSGGVDGVLVTDTSLEPIDQALHLALQLEISGFANPGNFAGDFVHSLDLPSGSDIFTLPDGFTANDVDGFIVNNRLVGPPTAVPEPSSALLLVAGFAVLLTFRRRFGRTHA